MDGFTACPASGEGIAPSTDSALALDFCYIQKARLTLHRLPRSQPA
ncbi:hypothetical protein FHT10_000183 [Xanthomonas arboricola]|nr:hypothetical protein [Xanthomonas cannabis]